MIEIVMDKQTGRAGGEQDQHDVAHEGPAEETIFSDSFAKDLVKLFKLLSDETRLRILFSLMQEEELHVRALCELLEQSQPAVSHHLALLRVAGLIDRRREGKHNFYHLVTTRFEELLAKIFAGVTKDQQEVQFRDFVLSHSSA